MAGEASRHIGSVGTMATPTMRAASRAARVITSSGGRGSRRVVRSTGRGSTVSGRR